MFPWFIWKEIISYSVQHDRQLCLVSKDWFNVGAGQFVTVRSKDLKTRTQLPAWLLIAENLELDEYDQINWQALKVLRNLKSFDLQLANTLKSNFKSLKQIVWDSNLDSIKLVINSKEELNWTFHLLNGINQKIKNLDVAINSVDFPFDKFLFVEFPKVEKFTFRKPGGVFYLDLIYKFFPNIQKLDIHLKYIDNPVATNFFVFSHLKSLKISHYHNLRRDNEEESNLFNHKFPNLEKLHINDLIYSENLALISQSMPKLKSLSFALEFKTDIAVVFPSHPMECLEEFDPRLENEKPFRLDLAKVPKLKTIKIPSQLVFINSNPQHVPLVKDVDCMGDYFSSAQSKLALLKNLEKVDINCYKESKNLKEILKLCKYITKLNLYCICTNLPFKSVPGPYKTTHLGLDGYDFLDNETLQWLANDFQLTRLTIGHSYDYVKKTLKPIYFPHLKELVFLKGSNELEFYKKIIKENEVYLKTIIRYDKN